MSQGGNNSIPTSGPGSGTVKSITFNGGLTATPDPVTSTGIATLDQTLLTVSDGTVYWNSSTQQLSTTAVGTSGQVLTSNGVGSAPSYKTAAASSISITGDSGGALVGNAFTISGGTSGLTFAGSGSTETLGGTLVVSNGGTGRTTQTPYAVICGGTTTTSAQQSVASVGTSGQILTSNGAGALPTFQTLAASGVTSIAGTTNQIAASASTGAVTLSVPSTFIAPGSIAATTTVTATLGNITVTSGNLALPATTSSTVGSITQGGTRVFHTFGSQNTWVGASAGNYTYTGGGANVAVGNTCLTGATTGANNTAVGSQCMSVGVVTGSANSLFGFQSGNNISSGSNNTGYGEAALQQITTGANNSALGRFAGQGLTGDSSNILIGSGVTGTAGISNSLIIGTGTGTGVGQLNTAVICGINGITVTGSAVLVSSTNQLGIAVSSRNYKKNIKDMAIASDDLHKLRPVTFNYKDHDERLAYGLIAEEVADVYPDLVVYDQSGKPQTVMYHELPSLLLNEVQKLRKELNELKEK